MDYDFNFLGIGSGTARTSEHCSCLSFNLIFHFFSTIHNFRSIINTFLVCIRQSYTNSIDKPGQSFDKLRISIGKPDTDYHLHFDCHQLPRFGKRKHNRDSYRSASPRHHLPLGTLGIFSHCCVL